MCQPVHYEQSLLSICNTATALCIIQLFTLQIFMEDLSYILMLLIIKLKEFTVLLDKRHSVSSTA